MRILMTTDTIGGVWTFSSELVSGLLETGSELFLISFGRNANDEQERWVADTLARWDGRFQFTGSDAPLEWMQNNDRAFLDAAKLLDKAASAFRPHVLHSNQFCFGALAGTIPRLVTTHSDVLSWAEACRDEQLPESKWLRNYRTLVQDGLDGADAVIAPTQSMLDGLSRHFRVRSEAARVIPNGRSLTRPQGKSRRLQAVVAGRVWDEAKNIAMLEDVTSPMPINIAGECCFEGQGSTPGKLLHLGSLDQNDLLTLFAESAVYICTSKYEPFGLAALEAALCGCAILANDLASLREVWGDAALYFKDVASLSEALCWVSRDATYLEEMQARSQARARIYSRDRMVAEYSGLYQLLVKQSGDLIDVA